MKTPFAVLALAAGVLLLPASHGAAEEAKEPKEKKESPTTQEKGEKERPVAFRTAGGKYLTAAAGGAVDASGTSVEQKQTFTLIDLNGGEVADGDKVRIRYTPGAATDTGKMKPSYWRAEDGKLTRTTGEPDEKCVFVVHKKDKTVALQAGNGPFISVPRGGGALTTTEKQDDTTTLEIVDAKAEKKKA